ncbi:glycoside hydrolase family 30 protein [Heterostelium album PN500]|uniref:Glycoside hydrolase family 30 protein n=1 Tax=Heterostelium pallidum (strain ATCC 26659 / Pp 5 / PN500) TaxID=670386 RepID=D3BNM4_HETP5|nr:glycoside hydrolase family 30 protein [Heterostelium album PN500]EFA76975.1 glycoside hydrolase family 30 protein [Heterostelium album PN500]|eukprot:XP_020429106.1 glycoside hydrolase family 30 protein [Heterostelium album PN500]
MNIFKDIFNGCLLRLFDMDYNTSKIGDQSSGSSSTSQQPIQVWLTTFDQSFLFQRMNDIHFNSTSTKATSSSSSFNSKNDTIKYQRIYGYGAALTQSSAYLFSLLIEQNETNGLNVLKSLFDPVEGIGLSMIRVPASACDFSLTNYTYDDYTNDYKLVNLSIDADKQYTIPIIKQIQSINPNIKLIYSPWTAPKWMKSSNSLTSGELLSNMYDIYTDFFVSFLMKYKLEESIDIFGVTLQNEPLFQPFSYPGMYVPSDVAAQLVALLGTKLLAQPEVSDTRILIYDHNWIDLDYPLDILTDSDAYPYVNATAFHCYQGDVTNQSVLYNKYPEKEIHMTECSGGYWAPDFASDLAWNTNNLYMGAVQNWASSVLQWNLALDSNDGPTNNGCKNCRGLLTVDINNNSIKNDDGDNDDHQVLFNVEYYGLAHFRSIYLFDIGSCTSVIDVATDEKTESKFESVIGSNNENENRYYVGDEVQPRRDTLELSYPVQNGDITNWQAMETIYRHSFQKLEVDSKKQPVLLVETPNNSNVNREKMAQIMFEKFDVPSMYIANQAILTLYSAGHLTAVVLDSSDGVTSAVPVLMDMQ